ncbi:MAG: hypothetical protein CMJ76_06530 [Planctomycetaceae bacterium]|nr:hypothetical protein [Planctomycetaceae bacterium]
MRKMYAHPLLALLVLLTLSSVCLGQLSSTGLITNNTARNLGLERSWYMQAAKNPFASKIADVYIHVSSTEADWSFEVTDGEQSYFIQDKDLDNFGRPLGREEARKRATEQSALIRQNGGESEITERTVPKIYMAVVSDRGDVQLVNAETGQIYWTTQVGDPRHPTSGVCTNDDYTIVITGISIFVLRNTDGAVLESRKLQALPGAGPVSLGKRIFVPSVENRVEVYNLDRFTWKPELLSSTGRVLSQPVLGQRSIAWSTDRGNVYVAGTAKASMWYRVNTLGKVIAPIAYQAPGRYVANCVDGFVYCVDELTGDMVWRQRLGEVLTNEPVLVKNRAYIVSRDKTCYCLDMQNGNIIWTQPNLQRIVAASSSRLYTLDRLGNLMVLNLETGGRFKTIAAGKVDFVVSNPLTDRIYMGTRKGLIQCVREINQNYPLLHVDETALAVAEDQQEEANAQPANDPMAPASKPEPPAVPANNPFGGNKPPANNPFAPGNNGGNAPPANNPFAPGNDGGAKNPPANNPFAPGNNGGGNAAPKNPFQN